MADSISKQEANAGRMMSNGQFTRVHVTPKNRVAMMSAQASAKSAEASVDVAEARKKQMQMAQRQP